MSGDVQPRKRRDKKKKKDDVEETSPPLPARARSLTPLENDDVNIHVHKEGGTGGGICAKLVFFVLLSALAVLVGLIYTEHRGLTDLDTIERESRFTQYFEGWVDNAPEEHDDHHGIADHDDDHDEHDDHDDHDEHEEEEHDDHDEEEEEDHDDDHDEEEEEEVAASEEQEEEEEEVEESAPEASQEEEEEEEEIEEGTEEADEEEATQEDEEEATQEYEEEEEVSAANDEDDEEEQKSEDAEEDNVSEAPKTEEDQDDDDQDEEEDAQGSPEQDEEVASKEEVADEEAEAKSAEKDDEDDVADDAQAEDAVEGEEGDADAEAEEQPISDGGAQEAAVPEEESWQSAPSYDHENITNADDFAIYDQLDEAQENLNVNAALALTQFAAILKVNPRSPRAIYGRARALDQLAEQRQSNQLLTEAITNYQKLMSFDGVPPALFKMAADRCINRLRFMGQYSKAIEVHRLLITKFPDEVFYRNQLAVTYLTTNRMEEARKELKLSLERWPSDGFALVHYGFILKVHDGHLKPAIDYLQRGIATREEGVIDGRFYFHLGDALARLGRHDEATAVYQDGAKQNVFLSATQRSLYNVPTLKGQPWWRHEDTPLSYRSFFKQLERNFKAIREEGLAVMKSRGLFQDEAENLRDKGDWKQFELFARGIKHKKHCKTCPLTCKLVEVMPEAAGCRRGQVKFSVMLPGTHVWPHCGPTNCRIRAHLGLKVPEKTFIRVDQEIRSWKEGEVMIFDDSFEHEVWHNGSDFRLVLIVDLWHPELTAAEKRSLPAI